MPGCPSNLDNKRARPTVLTLGAGGGPLDIFSLANHSSFLSPSLKDRLKYCLKELLGQFKNQVQISQTTGISK